MALEIFGLNQKQGDFLTQKLAHKCVKNCMNLYNPLVRLGTINGDIKGTSMSEKSRHTMGNTVAETYQKCLLL